LSFNGHLTKNDGGALLGFNQEKYNLIVTNKENGNSMVFFLATKTYVNMNYPKTNCPSAISQQPINM
jgi:hypothetical protein